jgi:hypothetical protein
MGYGSGLRCDFSSIKDYAAAKAAYEKPKHWKGSVDGDRKQLGNNDSQRKKKHMTIRPVPGGYACELHSTDVVVYHEDNSITLTKFTSFNTNQFANALLPEGIVTCFHSNDSIVWLGLDGYSGYFWNASRGQRWRGIPIARNLRLERHGSGWGLHPESAEPSTITTARLDRPKARAALKDARFADFRMWLSAAAALHKSARSYRHATHAEVTDLMLAGPEAWPKVLDVYDFDTAPVAGLLAGVRNKIYRRFDCIIKDEVEAVENDKELRNIWKLRSSYGVS